MGSLGLIITLLSSIIISKVIWAHSPNDIYVSKFSLLALNLLRVSRARQIWHIPDALDQSHQVLCLFTCYDLCILYSFHDANCNVDCCCGLGHSRGLIVSEPYSSDDSGWLALNSKLDYWWQDALRATYEIPNYCHILCIESELLVWIVFRHCDHVVRKCEITLKTVYILYD